MPEAASVARLNLLLELLSACSRVQQHDELFRVLADRLKWVMDFSQCTVVLSDTNSGVHWAIALEGPVPRSIPVEEVVRRGCAGHASTRLDAPLESAGRLIGAIRFASETTSYGLSDQRIASYLGDYLGATLDRIEQGLVIARQSERLIRDAEEREALLAGERAARSEAEEASRFKDQFLATLSHELRTPLNGAVGWAQMIRDGIVTGPKLEHAWDALERNLKAELRLVEDLLDISRIINGKLELQRQPVNLAAVVNGAIEAVQSTAEGKGLRIDIAIETGTHECRGDHDRLKQAVWNLLVNAVKFTSKDGRIDVKVATSDRFVEIAVSDTGIGIRPDQLPHVFERFRQADTNSTRAGGLGLGLSLVREIVELHGGKTLAESPGEGLGATFRILLPASDVDSVEAARLNHAPVDRARSAQ